jgi:hypothetical protein
MRSSILSTSHSHLVTKGKTIFVKTLKVEDVKAGQALKHKGKLPKNDVTVTKPKFLPLPMRQNQYSLMMQNTNTPCGTKSL